MTTTYFLSCRKITVSFLSRMRLLNRCYFCTTNSINNHSFINLKWNQSFFDEANDCTKEINAHNLVTYSESDSNMQTTELDSHILIKKFFETGENCLAKKDYNLAIKNFTTAQKYATNNEIRSQLFAKCAFCCLEVNKFAEAYINICNAIHLHDDSFMIENEKICSRMYVLILSLIGMKHYSNAENGLHEMIANQMKLSFHSKIEKNLHQHKQQNMIACHDKYWINTRDELFVATDFDGGEIEIFDENTIKKMDWNCLQTYAEYYLGPIEICFINETKGRGMIATEDISAYTLLLSERCVALGSKYEYYEKNEKSFLFQMINDPILFESLDESLLNLISNILHIFRSGKVIDKYRISLLCNRDIIPNMNIFEFDSLSNIYHGNDEQHISYPSIFDIAIICSRNSFSMATNEREQIVWDMLYYNYDMDFIDINVREREKKGTEISGCGLFVIGTYFNHDDSPNVIYYLKHQRLYLLSTRDINKGEELCIQYSRQGIEPWLS